MVHNPIDVAARNEFHSGQEAHVWQAYTKAPNHLIFTLHNILSPEEKRRVMQFKFSGDQSRYVLSHGILRLILAAYTRENPAQIKFESTKYGKPFLVNGDENHFVCFNMTHTEDTVCYIIAREGEVGIDLEYIKSDLDWYGIAKNYFTPQELLQLQAMSRDDQVNAFFMLWTRKEALLKAMGVGLTGMDQLRDSGEALSNHKYALHSFKFGKHYQGALAINSSIPSVGFFRYMDFHRFSL